MLNKLHAILKDPECAGNIRCFTWAFVCVMVYFSVFLYGFGVLGLSVDMRDIDTRTRTELLLEIESVTSNIHKTVEQIKNDLNDHRHKMFSERVYFKQEAVK